MKTRQYRSAALVVVVLTLSARYATAQSSLQFNGTSQYITAGQAPNLNTQVFTLECWFNRTGTGTANTTGTGGITVVPLISKGAPEGETAGINANYILGINTSTNTLAADFEEAAGPNHPATVPASPSTNVILLNTWYHAAVTFDGTGPGDKTWRFYLNGALVHTEAEAASPDPATAQHFSIGSMVPSTAVAVGFFAGIIDEVRVWNVVRTQPEIASNMNVAMTSATGLIGRWGLNEGTGSFVALDTAGPTREAGSLVPSSIVPTWPAGAPALGSSGEIILSFQQGVSGYTSSLDTILDQALPTTQRNTITPLAIDAETTPGTSNDARQTLIRFDDIFGPGGTQIPSGATILGASLSMNVTNPTAHATNIYRMLQSWDATATWSSLVNGVQANGTEAALTADVAIPVSSVFNFAAAAAPSIRTADVTISLQSWQSTPNNGWAWLPTGNDGLLPDSAEVATATLRPRLTVAYVLSSNLPPSAPTVVSPLDSATGVSTSPTLTVNVTDPESNPMTVTFFGREVNAAMEDFTIIALPDTQFYSCDNGAGCPAVSPTGSSIWNAQTQWIVNNRVSRNIVFVAHLGDCVEHGDAGNGTNPDPDYEWDVSDLAMSLLENPGTTGLPFGIPYGIAVGNHDQSPGGAARSGGNEGATTIRYTDHFGLSRWTGRTYYGGRYDFGAPATYPNNNDNHYQLFSAGGMDFIAISLEWDDTANATRTAVLNWANGLLQTYSDRRAFVYAHYLVSAGGTFSNQGQATYDGLKGNPNLFMMLNGHDPAGEFHKVDPPAPGGIEIHTMLSDYQGRTNGGDGWLRILTFSPSSNTVHVQTFSPSRNGGAGEFETDSNSDFSFTYPMASSFVQIGSPVTGVASGSNAGVGWSGLNTNALHEWYVTVSDGTNTTTGPTWSFTTSCTDDDQCDDGNTCTDDSCNLGTGVCEYVNLTGSCSDGSLCTTGDMCSGGVCTGTPVTCSQGVCNPTNGQCEVMVMFQQDDGNGYVGTLDTYIHQQSPTADHSASLDLRWDTEENGE